MPVPGSRPGARLRSIAQGSWHGATGALHRPRQTGPGVLAVAIRLWSVGMLLGIQVACTLIQLPWSTAMKAFCQLSARPPRQDPPPTGHGAERLASQSLESHQRRTPTWARSRSAPGLHPTDRHSGASSCRLRWLGRAKADQPEGFRHCSFPRPIRHSYICRVPGVTKWLRMIVHPARSGLVRRPEGLREWFGCGSGVMSWGDGSGVPAPRFSEPVLLGCPRDASECHPATIALDA